MTFSLPRFPLINWSIAFSQSSENRFCPLSLLDLYLTFQVFNIAFYASSPLRYGSLFDCDTDVFSLSTRGRHSSPPVRTPLHFSWRPWSSFSYFEFSAFVSFLFGEVFNFFFASVFSPPPLFRTFREYPLFFPYGFFSGPRSVSQFFLYSQSWSDPCFFSRSLTPPLFCNGWCISPQPFSLCLCSVFLLIPSSIRQQVLLFFLSLRPVPLCRESSNDCLYYCIPPLYIRSF